MLIASEQTATKPTLPLDGGKEVVLWGPAHYQNEFQNQWHRRSHGDCLLSLAHTKQAWDSFIQNLEMAPALTSRILVDCSKDHFVQQSYTKLIDAGFHIVSCHGTTYKAPQDAFLDIFKLLGNSTSHLLSSAFFGLNHPLSANLSALKQQGDRIVRVRSVFGGPLGYLLQQYGNDRQPFSHWLQRGIENKIVPADPRGLLSGEEDGHKLRAIHRLLTPHQDQEPAITGLLPRQLWSLDLDTFMSRLGILDQHLDQLRRLQDWGKVLRFVADWEIGQSQAKLRLLSEDCHSNLGRYLGDGTLSTAGVFEIYTEEGGNHPLLIQGPPQTLQGQVQALIGDTLRLRKR